MTCKIITFSGVDGAGKSTIIEYVEKELKSSGFRVIKKRSRPQILPILSSFKHGKQNAENIATEALPRLGKNRSKLTSFLRFIYYFVDYIIGQVLISIKYKGEKDIILYDRYYFDFIVDPIRANIYLPKPLTKFFYKFIFKPDMNIFLFASPDEISRRKKELDKNTIINLTQEYEKLFNDFGRHDSEKYLIIENMSFEKCSSVIIKHIYKILW